MVRITIAVGLIFAFVGIPYAPAKQAEQPFKITIPVTAKLNCPSQCAGTCIFQDTFVVELASEGKLVTSFEDYFTRTTIDTVEGVQACTTSRDFGRLIKIRFGDTDGEKICTGVDPGSLATCGLAEIKSNDPQRPAGLKRTGQFKMKSFTFQYTFMAKCGCDISAPPQEITVDLVFENGKFQVGGKEFKP